MFLNLGELSSCKTNFAKNKGNILDFEKTHVVKHTNNRPKKIDLIKSKEIKLSTI